MTIVVTGLDHHTAPIDVRERLAFRPSDLTAALRGLRQAGLDEVALLSTCNRVEIYAVGPDAAQIERNIVSFLAQFHGLAPELFARYLYRHDDRQAVMHLCATAAGVESMVLGEAQIQGQVREAAALAQAAGTAGPVLHALFRSALVAGKRTRTETGIGKSAVSISHAGVELARQLLGDLQAVRVLLVGSGKMSELAARNLLDNGAREIMLVNRSIERAHSLARLWGGQVLPFEQLPAALAEADVVLSSTSAPHTVIHAEHIECALAARPGRPLIMIDLAVPRDIDPEVADVPGAHLYNIDDLEGVVQTNKERRCGELAAARVIVEQETAAFETWLATRALSPTLDELRSRADEIRRGELEKAIRRLGDLSEREQRVVEALSVGIVNKLLHEPIVRLREQAAQGNGVEYLDAMRYLFGLDPEGWSGDGK